MKADLSLDWEEEMATARPHDCVSVPSNHPLYILYTSGTTGLPKVAARAHASKEPGSRAWLRGLVQGPGSGAWFRGLVQGPGSGAWCSWISWSKH